MYDLNTVSSHRFGGMFLITFGARISVKCTHFNMNCGYLNWIELNFFKYSVGLVKQSFRDHLHSFCVYKFQIQEVDTHVLSLAGFDKNVFLSSRIKLLVLIKILSTLPSPVQPTGWTINSRPIYTYFYLIIMTLVMELPFWEIFNRANMISLAHCSPGPVGFLIVVCNVSNLNWSNAPQWSSKLNINDSFLPERLYLTK